MFGELDGNNDDKINFIHSRNKTESVTMLEPPGKRWLMSSQYWTFTGRLKHGNTLALVSAMNKIDFINVISIQFTKHRPAKGGQFG